MNHTNEQSSKNSYSNQEQFCGANPLRSPGKKKEHIGTGNFNDDRWIPKYYNNL